MKTDLYETYLYDMYLVDGRIGYDIVWANEDIGSGHLLISYDQKLDKWYSDNEENIISPQLAAAIIDNFIKTLKGE